MLTFTFACLPNYHNNGLKKISLLVDVSYRDFALRNTEKKDVTYSNLVTGIAGMICEQTLAVRSLFCSLFKVVKCCTCKHVLPGTLTQSMRTGFGRAHVPEEYGVDPPTPAARPSGVTLLQVYRVWAVFQIAYFFFQYIVQMCLQSACCPV